MFNTSFVSTLIFLLHNVAAQPAASADPTALLPTDVLTKAGPATPPAINHSAFDSLLQKQVSDAGKVNYKGLRTDKATLDAYCRMLSENTVQESWTKAEKMAYWINTYNAFTLKLIVDNYPTKSILNFDGGKTWDVRRIIIGDKKYSLNNIENDILRPQFKDPRIHFAINCAAKSCPPIWNHAYTAENLEDALEARTRDFVNNSKYNILSASRAQVSKIFDWYGSDFGDLKKFLNQYSETQLKSTATLAFNEYNWDLNE
ncbi:MAG: DUF547 domain-containing protein [Saprospiraceae bacterium]|nr:DUF547 domain-containing protein [Saprospiraceae bacterium]